MTVWQARLFFKGKEYVEDRADVDGAKEWVRAKLMELGHPDELEWKLVGDTWRAGFTPNLDVYISPRR